MKNSITIKHSIFINRSPEAVWDFTQNYENRTKWDASILEAKVIETTPRRIVWLKARGNTTMTFVYKQDDRPRKTSLATREVQSPIVATAGGSWSYESQNGGTFWTQTNIIVFRNNFFLPLLLPFYKWIFKQQTVVAMRKAKKILERING